jgi:hypothetical protein
VQQNVIFVPSPFLSKEEIYSTLPVMYIQPFSLSIERLTPAHNPAGNETRNTNSDSSANFQQQHANSTPLRFSISFKMNNLVSLEAIILSFQLPSSLYEAGIAYFPDNLICILTRSLVIVSKIYNCEVFLCGTEFYKNL